MNNDTIDHSVTDFYPIRPSALDLYNARNDLRILPTFFYKKKKKKKNFGFTVVLEILQ